MKKFLLYLAFSAVALAQPQNTRTVNLTWTDTLNPSGTVYNIYRVQGACSLNLVYAQMATDIPVKTWDQLNVPPGRWCYSVTAVYDGIESDKSDPAMAQVKPARPTGLTVMSVAVGKLAWPFKTLAQLTSRKSNGIKLRVKVT